MMSKKEMIDMELLRGKLIPSMKLRTNMVRLFLSSTFSDMSCEREALLETYADLNAFCCSLGLTFEVVDLQWGICDATAVDHMTAELCLKEIQSCQRMSVGPNFIALLGNRYGYCPIPRLIPQSEFELLLGKLRNNPEGINLLCQWFRKDDNSALPTYVLQPIGARFPHYADAQPEVRLQHDSDVVSWQLTEANILRLLRTAALQAEKDGDFSAEQKHQYFKSVLEMEIELGLLGTESADKKALLFVRELPRLKKSEKQKIACNFVDITADGLVDSEAQELLSVLKSRVYATCAGFLNLHCIELNKGNLDPGSKEHAAYLRNLCDQFLSQMKARIAEAAAPTSVTNERSASKWRWLLEEAAHHMMLGTAKCAFFRGRENLLGRICLNMWEKTSSKHGPLVLFGPSGIGKTALMCKLAEDMRGVLGAGAVLVLRLLGSSPLSSTVDSVVTSVCYQICRAFNLPELDTQSTNSYEHLVRFFHATLDKVSEKMETLIILLDGLDQLSRANHAHKLRWLPKEIPSNVHLVVSTRDDAELHIMEALQGIILEQERFFEVDPLTIDQGSEIMIAYMSSVKCDLTADQSDLVLKCFQQSGHPLLLRLALDLAKQWKSYTPLTEMVLGSTPQEVMTLLLQGLEMKHGKVLVSSALGYIVSSRDGLSEAELRDVLSLDDEVLAEIYQHQLPQSHTLIRLPPLMWTRLKHDLGDCLMERLANGVVMLGVYDRQLAEVVKERYLAAERRMHTHGVLSEYFLGRWSQSNVKPVLLPSVKATVHAERKVYSQPLWYAEGVANKRKLRELPYHLIYADYWEDLCHEVIGNAEWLWCKTTTYGVGGVIEDLALCLEISDCLEIQLIRDTFILMRPTLDFTDGQMDPSMFYTEIYTRLYTLAEMYPSLIGQLCSQCRDWFVACPNPILVPNCGFLQSPGGPLKVIFSGFQKGVTGIDICTEKSLLAAGSADGNVIVWHLIDLEIVHTLVGHAASVQSVKIVRNGARCLSLSCDGAIRLWDLLSGRQLHCIADAPPPGQHILQIHVMEETSLFYSSAGAQFKAWHLDSTELLFQVADDGREMYVLLGVLEGSVVVLSDSGQLTFYDWLSGAEKSQVRLTNGQQAAKLTCAAIMEAQGQLVIGAEDGLLIWVSHDGVQTVTKFSSPVSFLIVSGSDQLLCAGYENQVAMFHVQACSAERFLAEAFHHEDTVLTAAVHEYRKMLITGSQDHSILVWCLSTGLLLDCFTGMGAPITALAVYHDFVISASSSSCYIKLWLLDYNHKHKPKNCLPACSPLTTLSNDGEKIYFLKHGDRKVVVRWDCQKGQSTDTIDASAEVSCMELAQKKKLLFCGVKTGTILIYPLAFSPETLCIPPPETLPMVRCMAVSQPEDRMAVAYQDSICVFEITLRDSFPCVEGPFKKLPLSMLHSPVSSMALLSDCRLLKGTDCGEVMLYDFKNTSATFLDRHSSKVTSVTVSNRGSMALTASQDSVQRLWSLSPLALNHTMECKGFTSEGILCSAFSENDKYIFTGSQDRTIKVWDVTSGCLLFVQYVYSPVTKIVPHKDGFVAISQMGQVIKEKFCCPGKINPMYNPIRNVRAQLKFITRMRRFGTTSGVAAEQKSEKPKTKTSYTCCLI